MPPVPAPVLVGGRNSRASSSPSIAEHVTGKPADECVSCRLFRASLTRLASPARRIPEQAWQRISLHLGRTRPGKAFQWPATDGPGRRLRRRNLAALPLPSPLLHRHRFFASSPGTRQALQRGDILPRGPSASPFSKRHFRCGSFVAGLAVFAASGSRPGPNRARSQTRRRTVLDRSQQRVVQISMARNPHNSIA
jgi:hypothetical protein